jgi:hypothetical protein
MDEEQELAKHKADIDAMSQIDMARLWRFAPPGHIYLNGSLAHYFAQKFKEKGGMTPGISKAIGWGPR